MEALDTLLRQGNRVTVKTFQLHLVKSLQARAEEARLVAEALPVGSDERLVENVRCKVLQDAALDISKIEFPE